jgi:hypothetical protein
MASTTDSAASGTRLSINTCAAIKTSLFWRPVLSERSCSM